MRANFTPPPQLPRPPKRYAFVADVFEVVKRTEPQRVRELFGASEVKASTLDKVLSWVKRRG